MRQPPSSRVLCVHLCRFCGLCAGRPHSLAPLPRTAPRHSTLLQCGRHARTDARTGEHTDTHARTQHGAVSSLFGLVIISAVRCATTRRCRRRCRRRRRNRGTCYGSRPDKHVITSFLARVLHDTHMEGAQMAEQHRTDCSVVDGMCRSTDGRCQFSIPDAEYERL